MLSHDLCRICRVLLFTTIYTNSHGKATHPQLYYFLPTTLLNTFPIPVPIEKQCFTPPGVSRYCLVYSNLNCNLVCKKKTRW
ncbi:hypothetical protein GDO81_008044 [Engystomops pustulosus]|uniref:Secreted protein n=1 Tax=Engystomops pustulosus TaxID=76066 RepID=A0AAV7CBP3_ENGPU|nr:hypothetical protein GDO81_008044 [Engystomops pustulosus]